MGALLVSTGCAFDPGAFTDVSDDGEALPDCELTPSGQCEDGPPPPPPTDTSSPSPDPHPALLAHWTFDGDARDELGRFDAREIGDVRYVAGKRGLALDLGRADGNDSRHLRVASDAPDGTTPGTLSPVSLTVALWMKVSGEESDGQIFERGRPCLASYDIWFGTDTLAAAFNPGTEGCNSRMVIRTEVIEVSAWKHVVFTIERSRDFEEVRLRLYVDGRLIASQQAAGFFPNRAYDEDDFVKDLVIGRNDAEREGGDVSVRHFGGQLDDVRIYGVALDSAQVRELYQSY